MTPLLTILIPVYNEAENIAFAIEKIEQELNCLHIINIVYDDENDTSIPVVKEIKSKYKTEINLIQNKYGTGVLKAIKTGIEQNKSEFIVITMADLSDQPAIINNMLEKAINENADIVCASRYMKGGKQLNGPLIKSLISRFAGISLYLLRGLPTHDATNNFKLYKKSFLDKMTIESKGGFEIGLELTIKAFLQGYKICETPTAWIGRIRGKSNFKLVQWFPSYLKWYIKAFTNKVIKGAYID